MPVRKMFLRAVVATAPLLVTGAPVAAHATVTMPTCTEASSTRLLTTEAPAPAFLWVQQVSPTETRVCFGTNVPELTVVVNSASGVGAPAVTTTPGTACATPVVKTSDPLAFEFGYATAPVPSLCFAVAGEALTLSFTGASVQALPEIQAYRGANGVVATADCWAPLVDATVEDATGIRIIGYTNGPDYALAQCLNNPRRIV